MSGILAAAAAAGGPIYPLLNGALFWDGPTLYQVNGGFVQVSNISNGSLNRLKGTVTGGSGSYSASYYIENLSKFGSSIQTVFPSTPVGGGVTFSTNNQQVGDRMVFDFVADYRDNITNEFYQFRVTLEIDRTS